MGNARFWLVLGFVFALNGAGTAWAHHSINGQFDLAKTQTLTGVLIKFDKLNPHCYWHFAVKGDDGKIQTWDVESVAPAAMRRLGVKLKEDIKDGDTYTFSIAPSRKNDVYNGLMRSIVIKGHKVSFITGN